MTSTPNAASLRSRRARQELSAAADGGDVIVFSDAATAYGMHRWRLWGGDVKGDDGDVMKIGRLAHGGCWRLRR